MGKMIWSIVSTLLVISLILMFTDKTASPQTVPRYETQADCERATGKSCHGPMMCDYKCDGHAGVKGGWEPLD